MSIFTKEFRKDVYEFCKWMPSPFINAILFIFWIILTPITLLSMVGGNQICDYMSDTYGFVTCEQSTLGWIVIHLFNVWKWIYFAIPVLVMIFIIGKALETGLDREFDPEKHKERREKLRYWWEKDDTKKRVVDDEL